MTPGDDSDEAHLHRNYPSTPTDVPAPLAVTSSHSIIAKIVNIVIFMYVYPCIENLKLTCILLDS